MRLASFWLPLLATAAASAQDAGFQGLGDLPGGSSSSEARGVSADGSTVVGSSSSASGTQAFCWTRQGGMDGLPLLAGSEDLPHVAQAVSRDGSVAAGYVWDYHQPGNRGFYWTAGEGTVGLSPGYDSHAYDVSDDGSVIVGWREPLDGASGWMREAVCWPPLTGDPIISTELFFSQAMAVSGSGEVVAGRMVTLGDYYAFRWSEDVGYKWLGRMSQYDLQVPHDVSADGSVIVGAVAYEGPYEMPQAFRWTPHGGMVILEPAPNTNRSWSYAYGVSADGSLVVGSMRWIDDDVGSITEAFIWDADHGMRVLADVLRDDCGLDLTGWSLPEATGISADGRVIVGKGTNPSGDPEAWRAVIPEPSSFALLLIAAGGVLASARRRRTPGPGRSR